VFSSVQFIKNKSTARHLHCMQNIYVYQLRYIVMHTPDTDRFTYKIQTDVYIYNN